MFKNSIVAVTTLLWISMVAPDVAGQTVDFVRQVQPILQQHCYRCHGSEKQKSGLRLDIKSQAFKGGDGYGPSVVPGSVVDSPLLELVSSDDEDERMPPGGQQLTPAEIEVLTRWVEQGAVWPDGVDLAQLEDRSDHWSFHPLAAAEPPQTTDRDWPRGDLDRFILARLEREGLQPAGPADRTTWLRRVTLDLTGLPPTSEQLAAFLADSSDGAHARVVDRLLGSPRYGERWAQHWLDVVRYADTHGFEVNTPRPNAWPYRDYVIAAFNQDTPYDQFIQQQLAGDTLQHDAATGFLVTAAALLPGQIGQDDASKRLARQDALDEIVINTGEAFMGLSIGCARCHDHKFDAISHQDYYSMQAFFSGVQYGERPLRSPDDDLGRGEQAEQLRLRLAELDRSLAELKPAAQGDAAPRSSDPARNEERFEPLLAKFVRMTIHDANLHPTLGLIEPCIDELEIYTTAAQPQNVALASFGTQVTASGSRTSAAHRLEHVNDGQYGNARSWMSDQAGVGWLLFELPEPTEIDHIVWSRDRLGAFSDRLATAYTIEAGASLDEMRTVASLSPWPPEVMAQRNDLLAQQKVLQQQLAEAEQQAMVFAGQFTTPEATHLLLRGDPEQPSEQLGPAVIAVLGDLQLPVDASDVQRRQALAQWIANPEHPLTARVMVNRIWQWHFGIGLVDTPSDFGRSGTPPSHPELLDWLATQFIQSGWSIKAMHRMIVLSATYCQSHAIDPQAQAIDADARYLWRFPMRRLEAEAIRDSMLSVSGRLNLKTGGPGFDLFESRGGLSGFPPIESFSGDGLRRMIYAHKVRMEREAVFGAFDCPDGGQSTARRRQSTTPIQALNLFNSRFTVEEANAFAKRIESEVGEDHQQQVSRAYELALHRQPQADEAQEAAQVVDEHGLATLCRALFNCNEFLFMP